MTQREIRTLHFDLGFVPADRPLTLKVGTRRHPLVAHTPKSLTKARQENRALALLPDKRISHYVADVDLPGDLAQLLMVTAPSEIEGASLDTLVMCCLHTPEPARRAVLERWRETEHASWTCCHPKLKLAGVEVAAADNHGAIIDVHDWKTAYDAGVSIVFHHAELVSIGANTAAGVQGIIEFSNGISDLATQILAQAKAHQQDPAKLNWVVEEPYLGTDMKPIKGSARYAWTAETKQWMRGPMMDSLTQSKNDPSLQSTPTNAGVWTVQDGTTSVSAPSSPPPAKTAKAESDGYWTLDSLTPKHGYSNQGGVQFNNNEFRTAFLNTWVRWLGIYAEFLGQDGEVVEPAEWTSKVPGGLAGTYDSKTKKYLAIVSSTNTILAIPVGNTPTDVDFKWPSNAAGVRLLSGGIGRTGGIEGADGKYHGSWDTQVCLPGAIMTGIFNFGIPVVCLVAGAAVSLGPVNRLAGDIFSTVLDVAVAIVNGPVSGALQGGNTLTVLTAFADLIPHLLLDIVELAVFLDAKIAQGAAEEATPIFGWIAAAVSIISDLALLAETTAEVALSPAVFEYVATRAIDAEWTLEPDSDHQNTWPREADHYVVTATYRDGTTRKAEAKLGEAPQTGPRTVRFGQEGDNRLPYGGEVQFSAKFYSKTGWVCGSVETDFMSAAIGGNLLKVPTKAIKERVVPLSANTVYQYENSLAWDESQNGRVWSSAGGKPTATRKDLSSNPVGHNLADLLGITLSQQTSQLGYTWEASGQDLPECGGSAPDSGQLYTFQSIDVRNHPDSSLKFVPCGFTASPQLAFDLRGPADGNGNNFYFDPRHQGYHLRRVVLDGKAGEFDLSSKQSWGRFNEPIQRLIIHPAGYAVGINADNNKIEVLRIPSRSTSDADAPLANLYSGFGSRQGLVHRPVGLAPLPGAGFAVLEQNSRSLKSPARVQAFDFQGNPVKRFAGKAFFNLNEQGQDVHYLDLAIESKGYVYVLRYFNQGDDPNDYQVAIYTPSGELLTQTPAISAGRLTVDVWRTVFTLDFQKMKKPADARTEPSVSVWLPSTP
ncbi:MAG: hypothetical protein AAF604_24225 [Acidobacteriota bacterium]